DAPQALTHGVPVQVEIARDGVQASVKPEIRVECADELGVLLAVGERAEGPVREVTDVALGAAQHEGVRAEVVEHRDEALAVQGATEDDRLLGLQEREMRTGRAPLGSAYPCRKTDVGGRA